MKGQRSKYLIPKFQPNPFWAKNGQTVTCPLYKFIIKYSVDIANNVNPDLGAQWLSGRVLDFRLRGCRFEPHRLHCVVSLSKNINPSLALVQPRKTRPFITERLLMGHKESNQTNKVNPDLGFHCW